MRTLFTALLLCLMYFVVPVMADNEVPAVIADKCVKCHYVSTLNIVTTKKEADKAEDLANAGNAFASAADMKAFLKKEAELNGKKHKTAVKLEDPEFDALIAWLMTLKKE